ncbi:hypothetical protein N7454_001597, partial [Penicillium verhagenii]
EPMKHFALIYIDQGGRLGYETSPSVAASKEAILSPELTTDFLQAVLHSHERGQSSYQKFHPREILPFQSTLGTLDNDKTQKAFKTSLISFAPSPSPADYRPSEQRAKIQQKVKPLDSYQTFSAPMTTISINDSTFLRRYYEKVFQNLQQFNCRIIAKVYVKLVEPRKQVKYPYNGSKLVEGKITRFSSEETKPPWWPPSVSHKEPDHLRKAERIALLMHILCNMSASHGITARRLKSAEQVVRRQIVPSERLQLLDELYRVRELEENETISTSILLSNLPDIENFSKLDHNTRQSSEINEIQLYKHDTQAPTSDNLMGEENNLNFPTSQYDVRNTSSEQDDLAKFGSGSISPCPWTQDPTPKRLCIDRGDSGSMKNIFTEFELAGSFVGRPLLHDTFEVANPSQTQAPMDCFKLFKMA